MGLQSNTGVGEHSARTILVVDDDDDLRDALSELLREEGFVVTTASSGPEALKRLSAGMRPVLILLDVMMPGMTGFEVLDWVRGEESLAEIPVTIMSGTHRIDASRRTSFLPKPIDPEELLRVVQMRVKPSRALSAVTQ
jgi:CheY-like chemotaxis protein